MKRLTISLFLALAGCAQSYPMLDAAIVVEPDAQFGDAGQQGLTGADLCDAAIARNDELQCDPAGPNVSSCIPQWNGSETCDPVRAQACLDRIADHVRGASDCNGLRTVWRADCLTACSPTAP